jgi:hypothetical protein
MFPRRVTKDLPVNPFIERCPVNAVNVAGPPPLTLSGERANRHVLVRVHGQPLRVTYSQFTLLVKLVIARGTTPTGFVGNAGTVHSVAVWRLRKAIDGVAGPGAGKRLVETGAGEEYRLTIPATSVALEPSCSELVPIHLLTAEQLRLLQRAVTGPCNRVESGG